MVMKVIYAFLIHLCNVVHEFQTFGRSLYVRILSYISSYDNKDMKINSLQRFHHPECPPRLELARDRFCFCCATSLRHRDR